jgi:hypothetical protein
MSAETVVMLWGLDIENVDIIYEELPLQPAVRI